MGDRVLSTLDMRYGTAEFAARTEPAPAAADTLASRITGICECPEDASVADIQCSRCKGVILTPAAPCTCSQPKPWPYAGAQAGYCAGCKKIIMPPAARDATLEARAENAKRATAEAVAAGHGLQTDANGVIRMPVLMDDGRIRYERIGPPSDAPARW